MRHPRLPVAAAAAVALALALGPSTARAQLGLAGFKLGASAGLSAPLGDMGDRYSSGYNVQLLVGIEPPLSPIGFRIDGGFHDFSAKNEGIFEDPDLTIYNVNANVTLGLGGIVIKPYLIGGAGLYWDSPDPGERSDSRFGFNAGGGIRFGLAGFGAAVEARYHRYTFDASTSVPRDNNSFVPVSFVLTF